MSFDVWLLLVGTVGVVFDAWLLLGGAELGRSVFLMYAFWKVQWVWFLVYGFMGGVKVCVWYRVGQVCPFMYGFFGEVQWVWALVYDVRPATVKQTVA